MTGHAGNVSLQRTARVAGFMFLFGLIFPTLNATLTLFRINVAEDVMATAKNVVAHEFLFRIALTNGLVLSVSVMVTALVLYRLLRSVDEDLALLALLLRSAEAILIAGIELLGFVALHVLNGKRYLAASSPEQLQIPVGYFVNIHSDVFASFPMLFLGLGLALFNYLFFKSEYIPKTLGALGVTAYALICLYAAMNLLAPNLAAILIIQAACWAPSVVFELMVGIWLLSRGVDARSVGS
jgi:hypothetical protein